MLVTVGGRVSPIRHRCRLLRGGVVAALLGVHPTTLTRPPGGRRHQLLLLGPVKELLGPYAQQLSIAEGHLTVDEDLILTAL